MRRPEDSCCSAVASSLPDEVRLFCATSELILVLRTSDIACVLLMFPSGVGHQSVALFPGDLSVHPCRGSYRCAARELERRPAHLCDLSIRSQDASLPGAGNPRCGHATTSHCTE